MCIYIQLNVYKQVDYLFPELSETRSTSDFRVFNIVVTSMMPTSIPNLILHVLDLKIYVVQNVKLFF